MPHYYVDNSVLEHFGVKGMRWGVRKDREVVLTRPLPNGNSLTVYREPPSLIAGAIARRFPNSSAAKLTHFDLRDSLGKHVGNATIFKEDADTLNLMWIGVNRKSRGQGVAQACIKGVSYFAKAEGFKRMTLEVPGISPDARHIYEKFGFKEVGKQTELMTSGVVSLLWSAVFKKHLPERERENDRILHRRIRSRAPRR